ncbi:MAG: type II toxin-antitoxin system RelE/ParE family toxin [Flavobacteriales bacterium]|nr:type II toxin-antitoxin system RelE/ParE family toxin [Flavobacteriales bacterium]
MALEIIWTPRASEGFDKIIAYLEEEWTEREVGNFVKQVYSFLDQLAEYPHLLKPSAKKLIQRGPINKHTILTYRIKPRKKQIQLLNIRTARQHPQK